MTTYGERLRAARKARKMNQSELAMRVRISRNYLSQIETDSATNIGREIMQRLAAALGLDIELHTPAAPRTVMARIGRQWCQVCGRRDD